MASNQSTITILIKYKNLQKNLIFFKIKYEIYYTILDIAINSYFFKILQYKKVENKKSKVINLVSIEEKSEIDASAETVFNILNDNLSYPKWSLGAEEIKQIGESFLNFNIFRHL